MPAKLKPVKSASVRDRVSREEWQVRCDLAAAYQLAAIYRWTDLIYTHFSARVPGSDDFLINAYGLMFDELKASNLVKVNAKGDILDDPTGSGINQAGFVIHGCVHEARPEINAVLHTHTRAGVAVSAMKCGLLPISQHSMLVYGRLAYHDYEGIALEMDERTRLARDLGKDAVAMILRNHGLLALGPTVREAFEVMYYLDTACQIQVDACAGGMENVLTMSEQAKQTSLSQFARLDRPAHRKDWPALLRMLERRGISYAE
jgi:ribulose-5-phosphate 4-epimerase/fuculose-1-phosphate aldolase